MFGVTGNFMEGSPPIVFLIPRKVDLTKKDSKGDSNDRDLCRRLTIFRYCGIDPYCRLLDSNTAYKAIR